MARTNLIVRMNATFNADSQVIHNEKDSHYPLVVKVSLHCQNYKKSDWLVKNQSLFFVENLNKE